MIEILLRESRQVIMQEKYNVTEDSKRNYFCGAICLLAPNTRGCCYNSELLVIIMLRY